MSPTKNSDESAEKTHPDDADLSPEAGQSAWPASAQVWSWSEFAVMFGYSLGSSTFV